MAEMIPNFHSQAPKGTFANVFGYSGVVGDGGVVVVDVPESMVAGELAAGRMKAVQVQALPAQEQEAHGEPEAPQSPPKKSKGDK